MSDETIFTKEMNTGYREQAVSIDYNEFKKVINSRRSVRIFSDEEVPDEVVQNALEDGLKAPNSSNLQSWKFLWVESKENKDALSKICFSQNGAKTAQHLIICIAVTNTWKEHCELNINAFKDSGMEVPQVVQEYYGKLAPSAYGMMGPFGILSPFKWLFFNIVGLFKVMVREPIWPSDLKTWATKTTSLACENIMLSLRAQGYDSLPMEGFDSKRLKKHFKLNRGEHPVMVIGVGKRAENGVYGPQLRFAQERFVKKV